ncbi:unnamed protein product [Polarella glacialis]|uniref:Uncharacterized protein n=1 Tax=Polarella glacialis TaxID=89957 RepID=A0A813D952_POLGL|nr:unnamed protein product [Polarella glacialis]|mmetsp:Transcript_40771/g.65838  ORF Transcript_40771/g.65838 Transcript_40771/m.65838 type:complete len:303 (-) Transcript_40771:89-997(-)
MSCRCRHCCFKFFNCYELESGSDESGDEAEEASIAGVQGSSSALPHKELKPLAGLPSPVLATTSLLSFSSCSLGCGVESCHGDLETDLLSEPEVVPEDWWEHADLEAASCCRGLPAASRLVAARVIRSDPKERGRSAPWEPGAGAGALYEELGARGGSSQKYVAVWLNMGDASLVFLSKATNETAVSDCQRASDALARRMKLLINPVQVRLPFPTKGAQDADTVGSFFGESAGAHCARTPSGAEVYCVRVDIYSKWLLRIAMQKVGFQLGNTVEMILVDWPGQVALAAIRLRVSPGFLSLVS